MGDGQFELDFSGLLFIFDYSFLLGFATFLWYTTSNDSSNFFYLRIFFPDTLLLLLLSDEYDGDSLSTYFSVF
jgi:hypothetical protein